MLPDGRPPPRSLLMIWDFENEYAMALRTRMSLRRGFGVSRRRMKVSTPGVVRHFGAASHPSRVNQLASWASPVFTWAARTDASLGKLNVTSVMLVLLPPASLASLRPHQSVFAVS